jgi:hypothetical protein
MGLKWWRFGTVQSREKEVPEWWSMWLETKPKRIWPGVYQTSHLRTRKTLLDSNELWCYSVLWQNNSQFRYGSESNIRSSRTCNLIKWTGRRYYTLKYRIRQSWDYLMRATVIVKSTQFMGQVKAVETRLLYGAFYWASTMTVMIRRHSEPNTPPQINQKALSLGWSDL